MVWAYQKGTDQSDYVTCMVLDESHNVIAGITTSGDLADMAVGGWSETQDVVLLSLSPDGDYNWALQYGESGTDEITGVGLGSDGQIFMSGYVDGNEAFSTSTNAYGLTDAWWSAVNATGYPLWASQIGVEGGTVQTYGVSMAVDTSDNLLIVGATTGSLFDTSGGGMDAWYLLSDSLGNIDISYQSVTSGSEYFLKTAVADKVDNIAVAGLLGENLTLGLLGVTSPTMQPTATPTDSHPPTSPPSTTFLPTAVPTSTPPTPFPTPNPTPDSHFIYRVVENFQFQVGDVASNPSTGHSYVGGSSTDSVYGNATNASAVLLQYSGMHTRSAIASTTC